MPAGLTDNNAKCAGELSQEIKGALWAHTSASHLTSQLESKAMEQLANHPHFRGRTQHVSCRCQGRRLCLFGCLPSYYLKQLAQEALRNLEGIDEIDNQISVASSTGEVWPPLTFKGDAASDGQITILKPK